MFVSSCLSPNQSWYSFSTSTSSVGIPTCRERDVGRMDAQIRGKARSSPAVGLPRALWTHFASAPFSVPIADLGVGNYATHYQAVTAAQSQGPVGVGSVGYVEVAGHEGWVVFAICYER